MMYKEVTLITCDYCKKDLCVNNQQYISVSKQIYKTPVPPGCLVDGIQWIQPTIMYDFCNMKCMKGFSNEN